MSQNPLRVTVEVFVFTFLVSSCANLGPVQKYSDETRKLSLAFEPMLAASAQSCIDKYVRKKMMTSRTFDADKASKRAGELCESIDDDNRAVSDLNLLLSRYADTLSLLADEKLPSYSEEFSGLGSSLSQIKKRGTNEPLYDSAKIGSISSLASYLAGASTKRSQREQIRILLDQQVEVFAVVDALSSYATMNYKSWIRDEINEIDIIADGMGSAFETEPLASNNAKALLQADKNRLSVKHESIPKFENACGALKNSHRQLRTSFDNMSDEELAKQLSMFARDVSDLRKKINEAYSD